MKKNLLLLLLLLTVAVGLAETKVLLTTPAIYTTAGKTVEIETNLFKKGSTVEVLSYENNMAQIALPTLQKSGWISRDLLEPPAPALTSSNQLQITMPVILKDSSGKAIDYLEVIIPLRKELFTIANEKIAGDSVTISYTLTGSVEINKKITLSTGEFYFTEKGVVTNRSLLLPKNPNLPPETLSTPATTTKPTTKPKKK